MSDSIWLAIGLVLIVEGIGPLIAPNGWRNMVAQLSEQPDNQLRRIGGCLVVAGAGHRIYDELMFGGIPMVQPIQKRLLTEPF